MANEVGIRVTVNIPGLEQVRARFSSLPNNFAARYMAAGLRKAAEDSGVLKTLKAMTPKGRTGNLRRSVAVKSKTYVRQGVGFVIVGYKSGRMINEPYDNTKLGYHQGLVEFGTRERFRKTKTGGMASTGKMPVGGKNGKPPVRSTWEMSRGSVESRMVAELSRAFDNAARDLADFIRGRQGRRL